MTVKQIKWILVKALKLIQAYENRTLSDDDYQQMVYDADEIINDSKNNQYCRDTLLAVLECFDRESRRENAR